jgi:hypothetical protein
MTLKQALVDVARLGKGPKAERQLAILARQTIEHPHGIEILPELISAIKFVDSRRFFEQKIVQAVVERSLSGSERIKREIISGNPDQFFQKIITYGSDEQFILFLKMLTEYVKELHVENAANYPPSVLRVLSEVESRLAKTDLLPSMVSTAISTVGRLKIANEQVFKAIIKSVLAIDSSDLQKFLRPASGLVLLREMGWSGFMHSGLIAHLSSLFVGFKQYQGLSSVWMIAGGLTPEIVKICMQAVRRDFARIRDPNSPHRPTVEGHCQIIRRLVACGFYTDAMELFRQFPREEYEKILRERNAASQIQRLFFASFLNPEIVLPEEVLFLKPRAGEHETSSLTVSAGEPSSFVHALAVKALKQLGVNHVSEHVDEPTQLMIDIYVPDRNLVIEVQGPSHYITDLASGETKLRPEDKFKIAVLKARGYRVGILSVHEFGRMNATRNAENTVREFLEAFPVVN